MQSRWRRALAVCIGLAGITAAVWPQAGGSALTGRVLDPGGSVIVNAHVTATASSTGLNQSSDTTSAGVYTFLFLAPGPYRLDVAAGGFKGLRREGIILETGQTVKADLALEPGSNSETVVVSSQAASLQSASSDVETVIHGEAVPAMPLNGRNFVQLSTLAPGVELPPGTQLPRVNGGRPRTNEYLFDGISALQP